MGDFKINEKTVFTQSGSAEPAMGSTITGIPAAGVTGVLPVGVTGGSGLTSIPSPVLISYVNLTSASSPAYIDLGVNGTPTGSTHSLWQIILSCTLTGVSNPLVKCGIGAADNGSNITSGYRGAVEGFMQGTTSVEELSTFTDCLARPRNGHGDGDYAPMTMTGVLSRVNGFFSMNSQWQCNYNHNSVETSHCAGTHWTAYGDSTADDKNLALILSNGSFRNGFCLVYSYQY